MERAALLLSLVLIARLVTPRPPEAAGQQGTSAPPGIRQYILGALAAVALLALLLGINDGIATTLHAADGAFQVYGYPRLLAIPGLLAAGAVADLRDRRFFPYITLLSMIIMTLAVLLFSTPATYNTGIGILYFFGAFVSLFSIVPFMDWALVSAKPALMATAGRSVRYAFSGLAIMGGGVLFGLVPVAALLAVYVVLLALLCSVFFFMGQLRLPARRQDGQENSCKAFALAHSLTEREEEILTMLSGGRSTAEMAKTLYISDKTVRNHISNMLAKTGAHSRTELMLLVRQAQLENRL